MIRRKQRWKIHRCETCERWTSGGVMVVAGEGPMRACRRRHRVFRWVCDDCQRSRENLQAVDGALTAWEIERGYRAS
jgi:hypothetical protein